MSHFRHFMQAHRKVYEWSRGWIGGNLLGIRMVLMYTIGRKSAKVIPTPVACYRLDEGGVWVHATNDGQDQAPSWWLNLQAQPEIDIRLGRERWRVRAEEVDAGRYARIWEQMVKAQPRIADYPQRTSRHIPLVYLRFLARID